MNRIRALAFAFVFTFSLGCHAADGFSLSSPTVKAESQLTNDQVFNGFGCEGKNISPALVWKNAPKGTRSFAVTVYDPDAPTGSGWWHWVVVNIPATVTKLDEGAGDRSGKSLPEKAMHIRTDFGYAGFGGACPPKGDKPHRYIFTVFALKTEKLDLPPDATAALAGFMIHGEVIAKASFTAYYGR
ncbi:MAG: YbhB/YbcL family Raf kinase inhibitor-like protein [Proteobacteria bacterium]|nr:YbhB/YbcL family Raf kinase inhibitor-like protein [Pseudomonadota bacterium]MCL2307405.1 YbhB/YbcL family Raf kinase inhibitor-like protein [Pseudomonadota bacterium]